MDKEKKEKPFKEAEPWPVMKHYPEAGEKHYSLPYGLLLDEKDFNLSKDPKNYKDVDIFHEYAAIAAVFDRVKFVCGDVPSLVVADYKFSETFNERQYVFNARTSRRNIPDLREGSHCILLSYPTEDKVIRASGTGKTLILKKRAERLVGKDGEGVIVINLAGGCLTEDLRRDLNGKDITVVDGREEGISENLPKLIAFLEKQANKDVLIDEVSLTLGIQGPLVKTSLNEHWKQIFNMVKHVRSLTVAFRPNDPTYTKDINPSGIEIPDVDNHGNIEVHILTGVKRNAQQVSQLFLALGDYSRRTFVCKEPTIRGVTLPDPKEPSMPKLLPIPSCSTLHDSEKELTCEAVRCSQVIHKYLGKFPTASQNPLYVVVDTTERRNRLVNALCLVYKIIVKFVDAEGRFLVKSVNPNGRLNSNTSGVVILTADQALGCYLHDVLIMDLPKCTWRNFVRMVSSRRNGIIIAIEPESLQVGKYSFINDKAMFGETAEMYAMNIQEYKEGLEEKLKIAFDFEDQQMTHFDAMACQNSMPDHQEKTVLNEFEARREVVIIDETRKEGIARLNVILGHSSSGKSYKLLDMITSIPRHEQAQHKILLFLMGSVLSKEISVGHLDRRGQEILNDLVIIRSEALSPINIIKHAVVKDIAWRHLPEIMYIFVDDYSIQSFGTEDEIKLWNEVLEDLRTWGKNLRLTIVFQSHAEGGRRISMSMLMTFFEEKKEEHVWGAMQDEGHVGFQKVQYDEGKLCMDEGTLLWLDAIGNFLLGCETCKEFSSLGRLRGYEKVENLDMRNKRIYMGADDERPLAEVMGEYVAQNYPEVCTKAHSLPEGFILKQEKFKELEGKIQKAEEEVDMPLEQQSIAMVFDRLKYAFKDVPSLTIADYTFTETLLRGINEQQKDYFLKKYGITEEHLASGAHDVFGIGISDEDILGLFFQIDRTTSKGNSSAVFESLKKCTQRVRNDINIFRTVCSQFSISFVKLAGFAAFPMLKESDLQKVIKCKNCRMRILTSEDLKNPDSFNIFLSRNDIKIETFSNRDPESPSTKSYKEIFSLYVCAASTVELPRNPTQLYAMSEEQMKPMLVILTPRQRELVKSESNILLMTGTSGTGKTFVLKKRALDLFEKDPVLVLNLPGGDLTEDFRGFFKDAKEIEVIDGREGREKGLEEDLQGFKEFLIEKGRGKHVLIDEVPLTLGFPDIITTKALSDHWNWIKTLDVKTITICFRPNDQSYTRDFPLEEVKPAGYSITVLDSVKRNTRKISELFMAIGNYSRRVFVSSKLSLKIDSDDIGGECLPRFISMTSCQALHRKWQDEMICECVRASDAIYEECRKASEKRPVFVVVDEIWRRNAFLNTFMSLYPEFPVLFLKRGDFHGKPAPEGSFPLVVVTEEEMIGCHPLNVTVVLDFPRSQWENYNRLIASTRENKILVIEEEAWRTGKFSHVPPGIKETPGWKIEKGNIDKESLNAKLEKVWKEHGKKYLFNFPQQSFPGMEMDWDGRGEEDADVAKILASSLSGIFGYPASGKSRKVNLLIGRVTGRVLILHCGGELSRQVYRQRWKGKENVELDEFHAGPIDSLKVLIEKVEKKEKKKDEDKHMKEMEKGKERKKKAKGSKKPGKGKAEGKREETGEKTEPDPLVVVVEDCPFFDRFPESTVDRLKEMKMKLILAFEPHSNKTPDISVDRVVEMLNKRRDCTAIVLRSELSNLALMRHIRENETPIALDLESKNLSVSALPTSIVPGLPIEYVDIKAEICWGRHLGYICSGKSTCGITANALSSLLRSEPFESTNEAPHILVSEEGLLSPLREKVKTWPRIQVKHLKDFRGCEASIVISFNVSDDWLLEVISRSRTRLVVIDNLIQHQNLWRQMRKEGRVEPISCPTDPEDDLRILLGLDDQEMFLDRPTWDEAGIRVGEKAMQRGDILDRDTGAIRFLPPETLAAIDEKLSQSSPFSDWGYVWSGLAGEVPAVSKEKSEEILKVLKQSGVEWHERYPPVALKTRTGSGAAGFLETMSLLLTGSLLHLPLLKPLQSSNVEKFQLASFITLFILVML
ncbi:unnamed protein product [Darwinula stevensoni]|uniref:Uncharacterized protein n=1 Tax=Darwinula stevensoni TaxID=69355 RepID=A0A7R9A8T1_9CRUS|nr:unnamed protein product [Darwinula stevensoni]CAG0896696.1 unnamed protein product [Darwinula stevensoni]